MSVKEDNVYRSMIEDMGGLATFPRGVSMRPLIRQGRGYVSVVRTDHPQIGDILHFEEMRRGKLTNIVHRLIAIRDDGTYVTRGDNCLHCEYIRREAIVGKVDKIVWLKDKTGIHLLPRLLGKKREEDGNYVISVDSPSYLRYVRIWNTIWPLRRVYYKVRGGIYSRLRKITWLRRLKTKIIKN